VANRLLRTRKEYMMKFITHITVKATITSMLLLPALLGSSCTSRLDNPKREAEPEPIVNGAPLSSHAPNPVLCGGEVTAKKQNTIRIGNTERPRWGWADVPVDMVEKAQTRLKPPASSWDVSHHWHEEGNTIKVLLLRDNNRTPCLFTCTQGKWTLMEGEQGMRQISLMEQERLQKLPRWSAAELYRLCGNIAYLHARPDRYELQSTEKHLSAWLGGEVKDLNVLKKYCVDPRVVQDGADYVITCYAITRAGSLERWKTQVRRQDNGRCEIVDIAILEMMRKGSFRWALVP
jgi:hypothetical protein